MKKIITLTAVAFMAVSAKAQFSNLLGTGMIGAEVGSSNDGGVVATGKTTFTKVLPSVNYFIAPSTAVGIKFGIDNSKYLKTNSPDSNNNKFVVAPMVRHYWNLKGKFYFFGEANLPIGFASQSQGSANNYKTTTIDLNINPGFQYFLTKWFAVETSANLFNFNTSNYKPKVGNSTNSSSFSLNTDKSFIGTMNVGFKFLFK